MKEQKLCNNGFILTEAVVGVALFFVLMIGVLHAVAYMTDRVSDAAHHHALLSYIIADHPEVKCEDVSVSLPYAHAAVKWCKKSASVGKQSVFVWCVQQSGRYE